MPALTDLKTAALIRARDWFVKALISGAPGSGPDWNEAGDVFEQILVALQQQTITERVTPAQGDGQCEREPLDATKPTPICGAD